MSDLARLRDQLYAVVLATPLLVSCRGGRAAGPEPGTPPIDAAARIYVDADVSPIVWVDAMPPIPNAAVSVSDTYGLGVHPCDHGTWCGTREEAESHRDGTDSKLGCPEALDDRLWFGLDPDETRARRDTDLPGACCYEWAYLCPGGRPYGAPAIAGATVAERWLAAAQTEHASVSSFARASLELMAVGAPPALIAGCHRAALDEVRHAAACLALASRHAGRAVAVAPVPGLAPRGGGIVRVAVDTYLEGCVAETHGALVAQRALEGCGDPEATRALRRIARDEARHAELAWQIVAWAIDAGGAPVRDAIAAVSRGLGPSSTPRAGDARLAGTGQLDDAALDVAARDVWHAIIAPLTERLLAA